ncbi:MinD/ParA family protein [Nocardiopsis sp. NPDC006198]|uniref:MinD/ParA family protein n=1 Tax=Nocardiopsis sp. NPDC006198 TaxID=3154472 RepID=UPI0033B080A3
MPPSAAWQEAIADKNAAVHSQRTDPAQSGLRKALSRASFGLIPAQTPRQARMHELGEVIALPLPEHHRVAVLGLKGGVGKTTTTVALGSVLASQRESRIIAVDGNPDRGTLGDRVRRTTDKTVHDLYTDAETISRYTQLRAYTSANSARLQILSSYTTGPILKRYDAASYKVTADLLEQHFDLVVTDCGTGLLDPAMASILDLADQVIIVLEPAVDASNSAMATLQWLHQNGYAHLAAASFAVVSGVQEHTRRALNLDQIIAQFEQYVRGVVQVPYDDHLAEGSVFDLDLLHARTRESYMDLAARVVGRLAEASGGR